MERGGYPMFGQQEIDEAGVGAGDLEARDFKIDVTRGVFLKTLEGLHGGHLKLRARDRLRAAQHSQISGPEQKFRDRLIRQQRNSLCQAELTAGATPEKDFLLVRFESYS